MSRALRSSGVSFGGAAAALAEADLAAVGVAGFAAAADVAGFAAVEAAGA
jgi:hypothetical protein